MDGAARATPSAPVTQLHRQRRSRRQSDDSVFDQRSRELAFEEMRQASLESS